MMPSANQESRSLNIGAVIGGAVGGVAVVAALGFFIWWYRRRNQHHAVPIQAVPLELPESTAREAAFVTNDAVNELEGTTQNADFVAYDEPRELDGSDTAILKVSQ